MNKFVKKIYESLGAVTRNSVGYINRYSVSDGYDAIKQNEIRSAGIIELIRTSNGVDRVVIVEDDSQSDALSKSSMCGVALLKITRSEYNKLSKELNKCK